MKTIRLIVGDWNDTKTAQDLVLKEGKPIGVQFIGDVDSIRVSLTKGAVVILAKPKGEGVK